MPVIARQYIIQGESLKTLDFSRATAVPTLASTRIAIPNDCQIWVPSALHSDWTAATNWSAFASHIVPVTVNSDGSIIIHQ